MPRIFCKDSRAVRVRYSVAMSLASRLRVVNSCCTLALVLAGCASQPTGGPSPKSEQQATDANSHLMVAEIALQRGEYYSAATEYVAAARLASDPTLAQRATAVAFENGQMSIAMDGAKRWLELEPASVDAHRYMAVAALRLHKLDESQRHLEPVLDAAYATPA